MNCSGPYDPSGFCVVTVNESSSSSHAISTYTQVFSTDVWKQITCNIIMINIIITSKKLCGLVEIMLMAMVVVVVMVLLVVLVVVFIGGGGGGRKRGVCRCRRCRRVSHVGNNNGGGGCSVC